jgi:hypothetical protein
LSGPERALEGSAFHAYRRAWATARKHLPLKDVAAAGGWKSTETLLRCYTQTDEETILAVVMEPQKCVQRGGNHNKTVAGQNGRYGDASSK